MPGEGYSNFFGTDLRGKSTVHPPVDSTEAGREYADEMARRDAENPVRCEGCGGKHGAVLVCGGCEAPVEDCVCGGPE